MNILQNQTYTKFVMGSHAVLNIKIYLEVLQILFFKIFFIWKCIEIFYFFKIYFLY
jgi:hypothetical protein